MIIAVSWSSIWLIVTIWPSFIIALMTSEAFTDILCARSATVIVSGTCTSRTIGSVGAWNVGLVLMLATTLRAAAPAAIDAAAGVATRLDAAALGCIVLPAALAAGLLLVRSQRRRGCRRCACSRLLRHCRTCRGRTFRTCRLVQRTLGFRSLRGFRHLGGAAAAATAAGVGSGGFAC